MHSCAICVAASIYWYEDVIFMHFHLFIGRCACRYCCCNFIIKRLAIHYGLSRFQATSTHCNGNKYSRINGMCNAIAMQIKIALTSFVSYSCVMLFLFFLFARHLPASVGKNKSRMTCSRILEKSIRIKFDTRQRTVK